MRRLSTIGPIRRMALVAWLLLVPLWASPLAAAGLDEALGLFAKNNFTDTGKAIDLVAESQAKQAAAILSALAERA